VSASTPWPALPYEGWKETCTTLHLWSQVVGKIRTVNTPWMNHSWHVALYVTTRGLTTSPIPHGGRTFQVDFDLFDGLLAITGSDGSREALALEPMSVSDFYSGVLETLDTMGFPTEIHPSPNEIPDATPFPEDTAMREWDGDAARRFFTVLSSVDRVFKRFRSRYLGKCSPVHFFWGSFDLAVTRFSGDVAPEHPGGIPNLPDWVTREAYSHAVSSAGFWPGGAQFPAPIFYSYAYPTPEDFSSAPIRPRAAIWSEELGEFVLEYEAVRTSANPESTLLAFLQDTYDAAARTGAWDHTRLAWDGSGVPSRYREGE
jgi:hypothetical protein